MNREQKAATIAEIAGQIDQSQAILAVDYRGITVTQIAELRAGLRASETTFRVVKNSLTERAADRSGAEELKPLLVGPTALAFVRGDVATAAKTLADYGRGIQMLPFKGGLMDGAALDSDQLRALSRLPSREVLYGQLVGIVASPVSGLVRTLNALLGGLAVALGQVRDKMQSGEIKAGAPDAPAAPAQEEAPAQETEAPADDAAPEPEAAAEAEAPAQEDAPADDAAPEPEAAAEAEAPPQEEAPSAPASEDEQTPSGDAPAAAEAAAESEAVADSSEPAQQPERQDDEAEASSKTATDAAAEPAKED
jgi:large subunit ribosomal protein L10